jgi:hypothetical protein
VLTLRGIVTRLLGLRDGWRELRAADVLLLVAIGLVVAAVVVLDTSLTWIAGIAAAVLAIVQYLDDARRRRAELAGLEQELAQTRDEQERGRDAGAGAASELPLLPEFARREAEEWARVASLDAVTLIRMKFERLSRLIAAGIEARAAGAPAGEVVPIERVVVYVDDLDRCQHDVVVGVLETLKLLVSLPHFVVVVGVDSRWLLRSLQLHFRELLDTGDGDAPDAAWAATPQNYLEKVFQYSLVLRPISETGFRNLIGELLGPRVPVVAEPPPAPGGQPQDAEVPDVPVSTSAPVPNAYVDLDLTPAELEITPEELAFVQGLAPLFETPRATKRLANVYRLLRVSVGAERLTRDEAYEPVLLLLAIGIGFPGLAGEVFARIGRSRALTWTQFVRELPTADPARGKLQGALARASWDDVADRTLETFAPWLPVVAEFSFHPWQELLAPTAEG